MAKLFARHFKVHEQQAALTKSAPAIAVGTPHRLAQVTETQNHKTEQKVAAAVAVGTPHCLLQLTGSKWAQRHIKRGSAPAICRWYAAQPGPGGR